MSDPQPLSDFAQQCMALVNAMNDTSTSREARQQAQEQLSALIRANYTGTRTERDYKLAQANEGSCGDGA